MPKREPIYLTIRKHLMEQIDAHRGEKDYRLPSENQLAMKFQSCRVTAQRALRTLEEEGLIYRVRGKGTFVAPQRRPATERPSGAPVVSLLVPTMDSQYVRDIAEGARSALMRRGHQLAVLLTQDDQALEEQSIRTALGMGSRGLIVFPVSLKTYSSEMLRLALTGFPTVQVDRCLQGLGLSLVSGDHFHSAYAATRLLIERGHTVIGMLTQSLDYCSAISERIAGYEHALREAGLPADPRMRCSLSCPSDGFYEKLCAYLDALKPTALIVNLNYFGLYVERYLRERGLKSGEQMTIAYYDQEYSGLLELVNERCILIDQQPLLIGQAAAELVLRLAEGSAQPEHMLLPERILLPTSERA